MKYYKLTFSSNIKEVGTVPQSETGYHGNIQQDFIPWKGKIDFDFKLPEPSLEKKAKLTSFLNIAFIPYRFLVVDDNVLNIIKKFNIGNHQSWKIKARQSGDIIDRYNLFFLNETKQAEYVDFNQSKFLIGKLGDWRDTSIRKPITIENYNDYIQLKRDLRKTKDKQRLRDEKIVLNLSNATEDMFIITNISDVGYYISERFKNAIGENNFTGINFKEVSELDKIEVVY